VGEETQHVKLAIDIYSVNAPKHPDGHYGYFAKSLRVPPRTSTVVEIHYDWLHSASFFIGGVSSSPDQLWKGEVDSSQLYSISAMLFDPHGNRLDSLTIFQELVG